MSRYICGPEPSPYIFLLKYIGYANEGDMGLGGKG
jgi:hypothetical protein